MHNFIKYSSLAGSVPEKSGAYNTITFTRDGIPVIEVSYYNVEKKQWYRRVIEEYGYCEEFHINSDYISYFKQIEGVSFTVVPETYLVEISGVEMDDE